ncbi:hypothetical protein BURPS1710b_A0290 [Burkholderia pseudomallei 1710b]|uniref:Uncharacterized protein n=1 Tax=Burkholderia pseudomallei (strain 1710b) TaxID=320372 RepID=Q3JLV5_BURP1|nr:hypothetical protein BURPS1710b_A0290 [Burkholderia pseudomallei 1710b]
MSPITHRPSRGRTEYPLPDPIQRFEQPFEQRALLEHDVRPERHAGLQRERLAFERRLAVDKLDPALEVSLRRAVVGGQIQLLRGERDGRHRQQLAAIGTELLDRIAAVRELHFLARLHEAGLRRRNVQLGDEPVRLRRQDLDHARAGRIDHAALHDVEPHDLAVGGRVQHLVHALVDVVFLRVQLFLLDLQLGVRAVVLALHGFEIAAQLHRVLREVGAAQHQVLVRLARLQVLRVDLVVLLERDHLLVEQLLHAVAPLLVFGDDPLLVLDLLVDQPAALVERGDLLVDLLDRRLIFELRRVDLLTDLHALPLDRFAHALHVVRLRHEARVARDAQELLAGLHVLVLRDEHLAHRPSGRRADADQPRARREHPHHALGVRVGEAHERDDEHREHHDRQIAEKAHRNRHVDHAVDHGAERRAARELARRLLLSQSVHPDRHGRASSGAAQRLRGGARVLLEQRGWHQVRREVLPEVPLLGLLHERFLELVGDPLVGRRDARRVVGDAEHPRRGPRVELDEMHLARVAKRHARRVRHEHRNVVLDRELHAAAREPHPAPAEPACVGLAEAAVQIGEQQEHGRFLAQARDEPAQMHALLDVDQLDLARAVLLDEAQRVVEERAGRVLVHHDHHLAVIGNHQPQLRHVQHQVAEVQPREHQRAASRERRAQHALAFALHPVDQRLHRSDAVRAQHQPRDLGLEQLAHDTVGDAANAHRIVVQMRAQHVPHRHLDRAANRRKQAQAHARAPAHHAEPARGRAAERDALDHPPQEEAIRERVEQEEPHQRHFCTSSSGCRAGVISARRPSRIS